MAEELIRGYDEPEERLLNEQIEYTVKDPNGNIFAALTDGSIVKLTKDNRPV